MEVIKIFTQGFYKDLFERTISTFAQVLGAVLLADGTGILEVDWVSALSVSAMAALLAVLKGFAASAANSETGASFGTAFPKTAVAAIETKNGEGHYTAEVAAPYAEGTPVDIVADQDDGPSPYERDHTH